MSVKLKRLYNEYQEITRVFANHPYIIVKGIFGNPPEKYNVVYRIKGLVQNSNKIVIIDKHSVEISLPSEYPTVEPMCRMLTLIFHPNIDLNKICIADHWAAGESLVDVIIRIGEMISYQNYNIKSPLNGEAARWAEQNINRFPIDIVDLNVERQPAQIIIEKSKEDNTTDGKLKSKDLTERVCSNCGANGVNIRFKKCTKEGHLICPDCIVECQGCGKALCISCSFNKCTTCGKILCNNCKTLCSSCGKTICKDEICQCNVCQCGTNGKDVQLKKCSNGHVACPACLFECQSCGKILCLKCSFNKCSLCGEIFCIDCHKICPSETKKPWEVPESSSENAPQNFNHRTIEKPIIHSDNYTNLNQQVKKVIACKKCAYTTENIGAIFCEMCGERIS